MSFSPLLPDEISVDSEITLRRSFDTPPEVMHSLIHRNLDHLGDFLSWAVPEYSLEGVKAFMKLKRELWNESAEQGYSVLYNGEFVGAVGMRGFDSPVRAVSVGYWISEHAQGNGIMTRSVSALIKLAFEAQGMNQVIIKAAPTNIRSKAIPERLGFTETGFERQMAKNVRGELLDLVNYSLLRSEWSG